MENELLAKEKENPLMGFLAMFQQMMVPQTKRISPDAGWLTRKFHKGRQRDFAEIASYEAESMRYQADSFNLMMDVFERMATFSDRIKLQFLEMEHRKNMMGLEEKEKQAVIMGVMLDNEIKQGKIKQMDLELKLSELEYQIKSKEMEAYLNGTHTP